MENISCHSNQSSYQTGIKNTINVEAYVLSMYAKFQIHPLMVSEKIFFNKKIITLLVALATNQIKQFGQKSYETWRTTQ